jgi:hypothetical protein
MKEMECIVLYADEADKTFSCVNFAHHAKKRYDKKKEERKKKDAKQQQLTEFFKM